MSLLFVMFNALKSKSLRNCALRIMSSIKFEAVLKINQRNK